MNKNFQEKYQVSCENCNLDSICIPRGLSSDEIKNLSLAVRKKNVFNKGEFIYRQGDKFTGIFAIQSGSAKLINYDLSGNEHILNILLPGELMGFDGFNDHYQCSVIALDTLSVCELPAERIDEICQKVPTLVKELFRHSSEKINISQEHLIVSRLPADQRMAFFLSDLSIRLKNRGFSPYEFNLPLSREDIGNHLGLAIETVSRMLRLLQNKKLITVHQKNIKIVDLNGLKKQYSIQNSTKL